MILYLSISAESPFSNCWKWFTFGRIEVLFRNKLPTHLDVENWETPKHAVITLIILPGTPCQIKIQAAWACCVVKSYVVSGIFSCSDFSSPERVWTKLLLFCLTILSESDASAPALDPHVVCKLSEKRRPWKLIHLPRSGSIKHVIWWYHEPSQRELRLARVRCRPDISQNEWQAWQTWKRSWSHPMSSKQSFDRWRTMILLPTPARSREQHHRWMLEAIELSVEQHMCSKVDS